MSLKPWVVQKFGGTSVGKFPLDIAKDIVDVYEKKYRVVIVCSARSNNIKSQGTTTCLLRAADLALSSSDGDFRKEIANIEADHINAAQETLQGEKHSELRTELEQAIRLECDRATKILEASQILDEVSSRTLDLVLAIGEKLSCLFMTAVLKSIGRRAEYVDLSRIVSGSTIDLNREFFEDLEIRIAERIYACGDAIPVVTGFFGLLPGGLLNSVGRGYTDLCSALIAVGLKAEELQIWKEVDGIFTADPRKVPTARLLSQITPEEAAELTYYGSEVIHPFTMEQAIRARIPIRIKNVMQPTGPGTRIFPQQDSLPGEATPLHPPLVASSAENQDGLSSLGPTAVTSKGSIIVLNIHSNRTKQSYGFLALVFGILDRWRLVVDLISTSEVHVSMAIHADTPETPLGDALQEIRKYGSVDVTRRLSIVSLVGTGMKQRIGIAAKMFSTLAEAGINLEMISQGASEINISCVVGENDVLKAINVLHHRLLMPSVALE